MQEGLSLFLRSLKKTNSLTKELLVLHTGYYTLSSKLNNTFFYLY
jgi:hypothetical protein